MVKLILSVSVIIAFSTVVLFLGCEPELIIRLSNNTNEILLCSVVIQPSGLEIEVGKSLPDTTINKKLGVLTVNASTIVVNARNESGLTVFSKPYSLNEFLSMDGKISLNQADLHK